MAERLGIVETSGYERECLRQDEEFVLYRGEHPNQPGLPPVLLLGPASTRPARVRGELGCASLKCQVLYVASPRPGERPVRRSPTIHRLYLMAGIPVAG